MKAFLMIVFSVLITAGTASAENSLKTGAKALSFGIIDSDTIEVSGRLFVDNDLAVLGGIGFALHDNDESTTDYSLSAGIRKYLAKSDLAPFVGGILSYSRDEFVVGAGPTASTESEKTLELAGVFGVEYFFAKQVSAEAQIGLRISDTKNGADETTIGTFSSGVTVNFYFP
jgi:hypothetical protein